MTTAIVAEIGLSHDGSLGYAFGMVDAVATVGVTAVKFQCHDGDECCKFRANTSFPQDRSRQDYWVRTAFTRLEWERLVRHVHDRGIQCGVSVFALQALKLLAATPFDFLKVGSAQVADHKLLDAVAKSGKSVVVSSGMSTWSELDAAMDRLTGLNDVTVLQCTTQYPTTPCQVGINVIDEMRDRYGSCKVGLSDHSGTIWPGIAAAVRGADMVEVHCTWDKRQWGPDVSSSLTVDEVGQLVEAVKYVEQMVPVDKDLSVPPEAREVFR